MSPTSDPLLPPPVPATPATARWPPGLGLLLGVLGGGLAGVGLALVAEHGLVGAPAAHGWATLIAF